MNEESKEAKSEATLDNTENISKASKRKTQYNIAGAVIVAIIVTLSVVLWYFYGRQKAASGEIMSSEAISEDPIKISNSGIYSNWVPSQIFSGTGLPPFPISMNPQACQRPTDRAILQPPDEFIYIGFHVDFAKETPLDITRKLQYHAPSVMYLYLSNYRNAFIDFGNKGFPSLYDSAMFDYFAQEVSRIKGILQISVMPIGMANIPDEAYTDFAAHCYEINRKLGVPILLRYGPEMNGYWMAFGMMPIQYKASFIKMANAVHAVTNLTAMMWAPNVGYSYPFGGQARGTANRAVLDTNGDGRITNRDDPYAPFYPGDEYVDWVGLSSYWYPHNRNDYFPVNPYFQDTLMGSGFILDQIVRPNPFFNFYGIFAEGKNKPMAVAETGAPVSYNGTNGLPPTLAEELDMKRSWWRQLWAKEVHDKFPLLKLILSFEESKMEDRRYKDWRVTWNQTILNEYIRDIVKGEPRNRIIWSTDVTWNCTGSISCFSASCFEKLQ